MSVPINQQPIVMAIFANTKGFGYAAFEGLMMPVDWGIKTIREQNNARCIEEIEMLIRLLHPATIVLQDCETPLSRCSKRIKN